MLKSVILLLLILMVQHPLHAKESNDGIKPKGAVCLIKSDQDQVLFVQSYLTQKLSLPGGYIETGETFEEAARRETYEETGLDVRVLERLSIDADRVIFSCQATTVIDYYTTIFNELSSNVVFALKAPHFGKEVQGVYLAELSEDTLRHYRYSNDTELLAVLIHQTPPSSISLLQIDAGSQLFSKQFYMIEQLQGWIKRNFFTNTAFYVFNLFGEGSTAIVLFTICALFLPRRYAFLLGFGVLTSAYSVALLKLFFEVPRPFYFIPNLQQDMASGYSFPSGNTTLAAVLVGLVLSFLKHAKCLSTVAAILLWSVLTTLVGISRVWMGVHYPADVFTGLLLGGGIALLAYSTYTQNRIESKRLWGALVVLFTVSTWYIMQPLYVYLCFATLGIFLSTLSVGNDFNVSLNTTLKRWPSFAIGSIGLVFLITPLLLLNVSTPSLIQLGIKGSTVLFITLWLFIGSPIIYQKWVVGRAN